MPTAEFEYKLGPGLPRSFGAAAPPLHELYLHSVAYSLVGPVFRSRAVLLRGGGHDCCLRSRQQQLQHCVLGAEARSAAEPATLAPASCRVRRSDTNARPGDVGEDTKPRAP